MIYLLYALLIWFLYQFIFKLVIPVYKTSKKIRQGFREMHEKMNGDPSFQQQTTDNSSSQKKSAQPPVGDYIDFEEIKEK